MNNEGDLDSRDEQAVPPAALRRLAELECYLEELRSHVQGLNDEMNSQFYCVTRLKTIFEEILVQCLKQGDENKQLKLQLERERRQKLAAVSLLQGGYPIRDIADEDSEVTTIDDLI